MPTDNLSDYREEVPISRRFAGLRPEENHTASHNKLLYQVNARLDDLFHGRIPEKIDLSLYHEVSEHHLAVRINQLIDFFQGTAKFISPLAQGELPAAAPWTENFLSAPLRDLHSRLQHLTWQAKQVANGDYRQRLAFLGDFADAFNALIISLEQKENILIRLARTDSLTTVHNRQSLNDILNMEIYRSARYKNPLALVMFDIDHFKKINDTFGHQTGDAVLKALADVVLRHIRSTDIFGRWGGEEFLIVAPEVSGEAGMHLAEKVRSLIAHHDFPGGRQVTASFGVAPFSPQDNFDSLINRADQALYRAKHAGRNRVELG